MFILGFKIRDAFDLNSLEKMNAKWEYEQLSFSEPFMRFTFRRNLGVPVIAK